MYWGKGVVCSRATVHVLDAPLLHVATKIPLSNVCLGWNVCVGAGGSWCKRVNLLADIVRRRIGVRPEGSADRVTSHRRPALVRAGGGRGAGGHRDGPGPSVGGLHRYLGQWHHRAGWSWLRYSRPSRWMRASVRRATSIPRPSSRTQQAKAQTAIAQDRVFSYSGMGIVCSHGPGYPSTPRSYCSSPVECLSWLAGPCGVWLVWTFCDPASARRGRARPCVCVGV